MHLKFTAALNVEEYKKHNITKADDILLLNYAPEFREKVRRELRKITAKNAKNLEQGKEPVNIIVDMQIQYAKRSIDQNSWLWMAHTLEANLINGRKVAWNENNIRWRETETVTPEMIHLDYMERFASRGYIDVAPGFVDCVRKMLEETQGHVVNETWIPEIKKQRFEVWKTSSYLNVREFCELAEKIVQQILSYGVNIESGVDFGTLLDDLKTIREKDLTKDGEPDTVEKEMDIF